MKSRLAFSLLFWLETSRAKNGMAPIIARITVKYIYSVLPFFLADYSKKSKQKVPGEALIFGNCVPMPLHMKVHEAKPAPNSSNCNISKEWYG
ncbi:hypothetical protein [Nonlabens xiamenensis]|uniref:hypothetical protein n=1 Tax=Nonlabens xiamenensis TaxID=2341043 RepID=UPI000F612E92|nr:hypothetical protein [Nonlabens xiamenensis]